MFIERFFGTKMLQTTALNDDFTTVNFIRTTHNLIKRLESDSKCFYLYNFDNNIGSNDSYTHMNHKDLSNHRSAIL